jgi:hypothetical protein
MVVLIIYGVFAVLLGIACIAVEAIGIGILNFVMGCLALWGAIAVKRGRKRKALAEERARSERYHQERLEQKAKREKFMSGEWSFPAKEFYKRCNAANITSVDTSFAEQKVAAIARQIMQENEAPTECYATYCSKEKLLQYFEKGKARAEADAARELEQQRKPKDGKLTESEQDLMNLAKKMKSRYGIDKRIAMLGDTIGKLNKKIHDYEEGQKALKEVAFLLESSVAQEKKKDWAFLGGLADGIAGPGAGVAVALNAMAENEEIERRNQRARQEAAKTVKSFYDSSYQLSNDIDELTNRKRLMESYEKQAQIKVVLNDYSADEIFKALSFSSSVSKTRGGNATSLAVTVRNKFVADVPEGVVVAVDGTLDAEIYFEGTLVDTVTVCLPLFGVATGTSERIEAFSGRYVEAAGKYTVKYKPNKLWIVEV